MLKPWRAVPFLACSLCFAQTRINLRYQSDFDAVIGSLQSTAVTIAPSAPPVLGAGSSYKFSANVPVVWSLGPGSQGSIDADGTYHAPVSVNAKQSVAGCQILPNNHVFNTRIDTLPTHAQSEAWIASNSSG